MKLRTGNLIIKIVPADVGALLIVDRADAMTPGGNVLRMALVPSEAKEIALALATTCQLTLCSCFGGVISADCPRHGDA